MKKKDGYSNQNKVTYIIELEYFMLNEYISRLMNIFHAQ